MKTIFLSLVLSQFALAGDPSLLEKAPPSANPAGRVSFADDHLVIDGKKQPQLFGAEVQYFRMRGGYGPNVPRAKVLELWGKALDRAVEAKMNTISFYIPWDFHEYKEGKFDFTGTVDEDGDGNADYPSRDILTFFRMAEERGITRIMARPGPYINAEWGFLGFGAIPSWFHEKYPEAHMVSSSGGKRALYDYLDPNLLRHSRLWFIALKREVLDKKMGPGKPVVFLQLDNETNYQWQGIYATDYAPRTVKRYQEFLANSYGSLDLVNQAHGRRWSDWSDVQPPVTPGLNIAEDQAWYRYTDHVLYRFLAEVRHMWVSLGVNEPQILFTLAESYNSPWQGLLPHYAYRNARGKTGLMTVNLYPKTFHSEQQELLNSPFKADLDVKAADTANDAYLGSRQEWVLGPEIQGGWWKGTPVTEAARMQTYLTVLGHGMKALYVYYFNEGHNWGVHYISDKVNEIYQDMRAQYRLPPGAQPTNMFWHALQTRVDNEIVQGHNARWLVENPRPGHEELFFDAPLDVNADPRPHFSVLKKLGERVIEPYQDFLARAQSLTDNVALVKDNRAHEPSPLLDGARASSEWAGGLVGYLLNAGLNPEILHSELNEAADFSQASALFHIDTGRMALQTSLALSAALNRGQNVVNFMAEMLPCTLFSTSRFPCKAEDLTKALPGVDRLEVSYQLDARGNLAGPQPVAGGKIISLTVDGPVFAYKVPRGCRSVLFSGDKTIGYQCRMRSGALFTQIGAPLFSPYNSNHYGNMKDGGDRVTFLKAVSRASGVVPQIELSSGADRVAVFARKDPKKKLLWVTLKTGARTAQNFELKLSPKFLAQYFPLTRTGGHAFTVKEPLAQTQMKVKRSALTAGIPVSLEGDGAKVLVLEPAK